MRSVLFILLAGCSPRTEIVLDYQLAGIDLGELVRVETLISVDPADGRQFFADAPYRELDTGIGLEVRDFNGTGERQALLTHDASFGYRFSDHFSFTLLPPASEAAPPLLFHARAMGAGAPIGTTMPLGAKFGPGAQLAIALTDQRCAGVACAADQACCAQACLSVASDQMNCGGCGMDCGTSGDTCAGGVCRCAGGSACMTGTSCCAGRGCVDLDGDAFNCGSCGHACNTGEGCSGGQCACGGAAACPDGQLCCSDGSCSSTGSCPCGSVVCNAPAQCCDAMNGLCADLGSDSMNCGACGHVCAAPLTCVQGACACNGTVCAAGDTCCAAGCRSLNDDAHNCGACGHDCGEGSTCVAGQCMCNGVTCGDGQICCDNTCVDPNVSSAHCGSCAVACQRGEMCTGGMCGCGSVHCVGNETCCGDGCFDLQNSVVHCGATCDAPGCPSGYDCESGMCKQTTCIPACLPGNTCVGTSCMCGNVPQCSPPKSCCPDGCFDLSSDHDHCNGCLQHACSNSETCVAGACKKLQGVSCSNNGDCATGHCADGVCCDTACTGACMYCGGSRAGTCGKVMSGPDPHGMCAANPPNKCGTTGSCNMGACAFWPAGTSCLGAFPDACEADGATLDAWQCDGNISCFEARVSCEPYACVTTTGSPHCGMGACLEAVATTCTIPVGNCAPDAKCCLPPIQSDCLRTFCAVTCP